ncbi:hypothetical protein H4S04_005956 [Coemansia sp. S16]|nr:hypothetical protein GGI14_002463 [Coemansia sp. S680]KAJ2029165.1 hypothetical protein H4S03_007529 [Coemansia sp. S3946]KAJ2044893.1 hypothetical protein H4S04_005956 [Coemansia sp. S16]
MGGVWLQICGLPPQTTKEEVSELTRRRAITIETQDVSTHECAGRFLVDSMETAKDVLQRTNYVMRRGSLVKIGLSTEDLVRCHLVTVKNFNWRDFSVKKLYSYSKGHGTVCNVSVTEEQAKVWFFQASEAQSFIGGLRESTMCVGDPVAESRDPSVGDAQAMEVIVLDDSDENMAADSPPASRFPDTPSPAMGLGERRVVPAPIRHFARKSLAPRNVHKSRRLSTSSDESSSNSVSQPPEAATMTLSPAKAPTGRRSSRSDARSPVQSKSSSARASVQPKNGSSRPLTKPTNVTKSLPTPPTSVTSESTSSLSLDVSNWQSRAPFIYEYIYCQPSKSIAVHSDRSVDHMLSVAWCKVPQSSLMSLYSSLGNHHACTTVSDWSMSHSSPRDDSPWSGDMSIITKSQFTLPPRGSMTNSASTLAAFNGLPAGVMHDKQGQDEFQVSVTAFKMHDGGNILFGCALRSVLVFDASSLKRKGTLVLLDNIDGVYDVGRDYVVANSVNGEIGVWKSGSRNHMWRYNDMRRFKALPEKRTLITALRVAKSDKGVYAGDSNKGLSYCDFRERYIGRLSSSQTGVVSSIEDAGGSKILVGTYEGDLKLLDTRFMSQGNTSEVCSYATGLYGAGIGAIRMCPHNENMFACSAGSDVLIYYKEKPASKQSLLFNHQAHRTLVTDFGWHPSRNNIYTIGSVDIGSKQVPGELQIWRPSDMVMY